MKKRITSLILVVMVVLSPIMFVNAKSDEHVHSENCIYSCELDKIDTAIFESKSQNVSTHVDHPGSENCIYGCVLDTIDTPLMSMEEFQSVIDEYKSISSDEELKDFWDKYPDEYVASEEMTQYIAEMIKDMDAQKSSCAHLYSGGCVGNHASMSGCNVACRQTATCVICGASYICNSA